ncbi:MAG: flagellar basal-body MS-ring/collar protein FliF [Terracidiphilus sp.]|jgi:flagellar M-ring protein FliF
MATGTQLEKTPPALGQLQKGGKWSGLWGLAQVRWAEMAAAQRRSAVTAAVLLVALLGGLAWYGLRPDWRTLYAGLDPDDARQMEQTLAQAQIPFEPTSDGSGILVPAALLDKARLAAASKGGVKSGRLGFEIFDKPNWVGSEFDEQVNYQRALEGELEHTIGTLSDVASARVHLVMSHDSLFRDQERPAKAAVVLKLRHRTLAEGEPEAIRNLVASAVDGLLPDRVVLVDAAGNVPLGPKTAEAMQLSAEQALEDKLIATLEPVTGAGNVRASVTLDYDTEAAEESDENYDPSKSVTLSLERTEQTTGTQQIAAGVPGAASNAPNTQAVPVYPHETSAPQSAKTESGTYGVSKSVRHVVDSPGRIRRLTAAIVVNDRLMQPATKNRAAVWQPRPADELHNLTALAQAAVGFDTARGDVVTVADLAFDENRPQPPPALDEQLLKTAEGSPNLIKYLALLTGLLVVVAFGLRPAIRRAGSALATTGSVKATAHRELAAAAPAPVQLNPAEPDEIDPDRQRTQEIFEQVTTHLKKEPTQSSRLLQSWIHSD